MIGERLERLLFARRGVVLTLFVAATLFLGWRASGLHVDAGFEKLLPLEHPYIQTFLDYREEFGGANRLLIAFEAREGDIFTAEFLARFKALTDEVFFLPGVNRASVRSMVTPNVRFIEIVEGGFTGGNVMPADFRPTEEGLAEVRENVLRAGIVGRLVANDFTAAMVTAELLEMDPATGERLDYLEVARRLEERVRKPFVDEHFDVHIIGFAKMIGDIADGAAGVVAFFGLAFVITMALVFAFTRSVRLTLLPLLCSIVAVVWDLGLLTVLGFGLDPMTILVPFLVFAIGVSHGVQMVNAVSAELARGSDAPAAARTAFRRLLVPGSIALVTDTIGFLTILLIDIGIIRELAITSSLGVGVIILTNLLLLPVLLSYLRFPEGFRDRLARAAEGRERLWHGFEGVTRPRGAATALVVAGALLAVGLVGARGLRIGDLQAGVPELRPDSRYNRDAAFISEHFSIGVDLLSVIVETVPNGCIEYDVMSAIDRFEWQMANVPAVQSTMSMPQVAKVLNAGWNEGALRWRILPRNSQTMVQATSWIETSTGLLNRDCSAMPVILFTEDHKAQTIERITGAATAWAGEHDSPRHRFRLATGNVGVMAATNEVVSAAQVPMLLWVYAAVVTLSLVTFRSVRATLCIVLPLGLVSVFCYALMAFLEIGLKVSTLPVAALGVGVGVDYGIYIFSRMQTALRAGESLVEAYRDTLRVTGSAVLITGLTLGIGVSTWTLSALQFQADMGLLLAFMLFTNMLGALFLLPALARVLFPEAARRSA